MRLLHFQDDGELSLAEFVGNNVPAYAILSHTWGPSREEVTYQDLLNNKAKGKNGYGKLTFCGKRAAEDGLKYFWIDTCCIDKSSSAELSESITSMFRWYQDSAQCYVYLSDVSTEKRKADYDKFCFAWESAFRTSRWFLRGWTLQELLAPRLVKFFSREGNHLGDKLSLEQMIHEITHIPIRAIRRAPLREFEVQERMSWMGKRQTTREEDVAYSLLGIFGVSMLPNYGEGKENALKRLQKEIREASGTRSLSEDQKSMLLESLRFDQIDARHMTIKIAHSETCKWLLRSPEYLQWLDVTKLEEHHGFIWIKGKPGTGKSTLMKFALANARKTMKDTIVISFFFNARGEDLEKSTIGTYRSLLLQLLERLPDSQYIFDWFGLIAPSITKEQQWTVELLQAMLEQIIVTLKGSSVVCFIDALDECEEQQIRDMVSFFERIGELAVLYGSRFQICFASRHYPYITIRRGQALILEGQEGHTQDIIDYLSSELRIGNSKISQKIRSELQDKASGVFMWVALVVSILNQEFDHGQLHALRRRLQEIPGDLHELFRDILTRDTRNNEELLLCVQWVLFAREPLSPEQLYSAVLSGIDPAALLELDPADITIDVIQKFILNSSKGLAEITMSKLRKVQFIHESVRDFLQKEDGLSTVWPELASNLQGQSQNRLKRCCFTYMKNMSSHPDMPASLPAGTSQKAKDLRQGVVQRFPFLEYAVHNVLYHAEAAERAGIAQAPFLDTFQLPGWVQLDNLLQKHEVRRHKPGVSLLYILAELNLPYLIGTQSSVHLCLEEENERYGCPIFAAIATGSQETFRACMKGIEELQTIENRLYGPRNPNDQQKPELCLSRRDFIYSESKGLLLGAAELGNEPVIAHLVDSGRYEADLKRRDGRTPLWWASRNGCAAAVNFLLDKDMTAINGKDKDGKTPLIVALENKNCNVAKILIKRGANVHAQGGDFGNALIAASAMAQEEIVELLVDKGADVNAHGEPYGNALYAASDNGHKRVVKLLLDKGADVNAQGGLFGSALKAASAYSRKEIVTMLIDKGARH